MRVAGIGCRLRCPAADIVAAVRAAEHAATCRVDALAAPAFKHAEPGLLNAAAILGLPLHFIDEPSLAQVQWLCPTRSQAARLATGHTAIAEAAAIAATGGTLLLPRLTHGRATCAIAASPAPACGRGPG